MKIVVTCWSVFVLLALLAFPLTADAFSRRPSHSEVGLPAPHHRAPVIHKNNRSVPIPGTLLLLGGGLAGLAAWRQRSRRGKSVLRKEE